MLTEKEKTYMKKTDVENTAAFECCDCCTGQIRNCQEQHYGGLCDGFNEEVEAIVKEWMAE